MGFFDRMLRSVNNFALEQFGIKRPKDAINFMERLIDSRRDDEDKVKYAKFVTAWLNKLSLSGSSEADYVLDYLRNSYKISFFCEKNCIRL